MDGLVIPRLEHEGAVGDDVLGVRPVVAELLDGRLVDREERVVRDLPEEPGLLRRQLHLERVVVHGGDGDLVGERRTVGLAAVVLRRALDAIELVRVVGRQLGAERPLPGVHEVLGGDRIAVRPRRVLVEVERDGGPVDLPAVSRDGLGLERVGIQLHERVHQGQDDVRRRRVRGLARIERRRLGAPGDAEHLLRCRRVPPVSVAPVSPGGALVIVVAAAPGGAERQDGGERHDEQEPSVSTHFCPPVVSRTAARGSGRAAT